jgi:hypothetical protein
MLKCCQRNFQAFSDFLVPLHSWQSTGRKQGRAGGTRNYSFLLLKVPSDVPYPASSGFLLPPDRFRFADLFRRNGYNPLTAISLFQPISKKKGSSIMLCHNSSFQLPVIIFNIHDSVRIP